MPFTTKIGTPIEPRNLNRHFGSFRGRAEVRRDSLSRPAAFMRDPAYDQGVSIENNQDVLGHSSPTVTRRSMWMRREGSGKMRSTDVDSCSMSSRPGSTAGVAEIKKPAPRWGNRL
jgi:hypothetical protein